MKFWVLGSFLVYGNTKTKIKSLTQFKTFAIRNENEALKSYEKKNLIQKPKTTAKIDPFTSTKTFEMPKQIVELSIETCKANDGNVVNQLTELWNVFECRLNIVKWHFPYRCHIAVSNHLALCIQWVLSHFSRLIACYHFISSVISFQLRLFQAGYGDHC